MIRKICAIFFALAMLLSLSVAALATETESAPALDIQVQYGENETVVTVYLQGCAGVTNGRILVSYDGSAVSCTEVSASDAYEISSISDQTAGTVALAWVGSQLAGESTLMLTLRFQAVGESFVSTTYAVESDGIYADGQLVAVVGASVTTKSDDNPPTVDSKTVALTAVFTVASAAGFAALYMKDKRRNHA